MKYYCGPSFLPTWVRRILSYKFNISCKIHDEMYSSKNLSRDEADELFFYHMLIQAEGTVFWTLMAHVYYCLVRCGGRLFWLLSRD